MCFRIFLLVIIFQAFSFQVLSEGEISVYKPHGIEFGSSKRDALEAIKESNRTILENEKDSKKVRRIIFDGSLVGVPISESSHYETRLEFFDKKLMSSALYFRFNDGIQLSSAKDRYIDYLSSQFGEALEREKLLSFEIWTWKIPDIKILLNSNVKSNNLKVEYIYQPVLSKKTEKELKVKRRSNPKPSDPAKEMFVDGTYSRPKY